MVFEGWRQPRSRQYEIWETLAACLGADEVTLGMAVFKGMALGKFRAALPYVEHVSAVLILLMGSYLVYYWLAKGGLLDRLA